MSTGSDAQPVLRQKWHPGLEQGTVCSTDKDRDAIWGNLAGGESGGSSPGLSTGRDWQSDSGPVSRFALPSSAMIGERLPDIVMPAGAFACTGEINLPANLGSVSLRNKRRLPLHAFYPVGRFVGDISTDGQQSMYADAVIVFGPPSGCTAGKRRTPPVKFFPADPHRKSGTRR